VAARARVLGIAVRVLVGVIAAPALLLTVTRFVAGSHHVLVRIVSFTPFAIPLYAAALVLLAGWLLRGPRPRAWIALGVVLLAGLGLHLAWMAPLYLGSVPTAAPGTAPLVVMNANMDLGQGDATTLVEAVRRGRVGLLAVEEITPELKARLDAAGLQQLLPYSAGAVGQLGHGTMVFARDPITDVHPLATWLDSWSMQVGDLRVLAVHPAFSYPHDTTWARDQRTILSAVRTEHPDLVVGDMNATLDHAAIRALEGAGLADGAAQANAGWDPTWPANGLFAVAGLRLPPVVEIDHVMVGRRLGVRSFRDVMVQDTDHRAVVATVVHRR
jgi:endonuclease/exonuclease/phosphatase family metal-dependent hydrolase